MLSSGDTSSLVIFLYVISIETQCLDTLIHQGLQNGDTNILPLLLHVISEIPLEREADSSAI